jgi:6-phosphofructokinase
MAERAHYDAEALAAYFLEHQVRIGFGPRVTALGHVQRGSALTAYDRLLAPGSILDPQVLGELVLDCREL